MIGHFKNGDRVRVVGKGVTQGRTGTVIYSYVSIVEYTVEFDIPLPSGKRVQTYTNPGSLLKIGSTDNVHKSSRDKKIAVFISCGDEAQMIEAVSIDDAIEQVERTIDHECPDEAPEYVIWDGVKYELNVTLKLTAKN